MYRPRGNAKSFFSSIGKGIGEAVHVATEIVPVASILLCEDNCVIRMIVCIHLCVVSVIQYHGFMIV